MVRSYCKKSIMFKFVQGEEDEFCSLAFFIEKIRVYSQIWPCACKCSRLHHTTKGHRVSRLCKYIALTEFQYIFCLTKFEYAVISRTYNVLTSYRKYDSIMLGSFFYEKRTCFFFSLLSIKEKKNAVRWSCLQHVWRYLMHAPCKCCKSYRHLDLKRQ